MFLKNKKIYCMVYFLIATIIYNFNLSNLNALDKIEIPAGNSNKATINKKALNANNNTELDYTAADKQVIFCIDREAIFKQSLIANNIKEKMKEFEQSIIAELKPLAEKFEQMRQDYEKKAKSLSQDALRREEEKMAQLAQDVQMKQMESQDAYKREEMKLTREFLDALNNACEEFLSLKENANVLLLPLDNGMQVHEKYNATTKIIDIMDKKFQKEQKTTSKSSNTATKKK